MNKFDLGSFKWAFAHYVSVVIVLALIAYFAPIEFETLIMGYGLFMITWVFYKVGR